MLRHWGSQVGLPRSQHSYLIWFSFKQSAGGLAAFRAFLKSEYSEENIEFWVSCEDYKKTKSPAKLSPKARKIYDEFISVQATKEVRAQNVPWAELSLLVLNQASSTGKWRSVVSQELKGAASPLVSEETLSVLLLSYSTGIERKRV